MSKLFLVVCIGLVVLSLTLNAKMVTNGDRHCAMAQGKVIEACSHQLTGLSAPDCCDAIFEINKHAETLYARQHLCMCFQEIIRMPQYTKLIGMPKHCKLPEAIPYFDPKTDCERYLLYFHRT